MLESENIQSFGANEMATPIEVQVAVLTEKLKHITQLLENHMQSSTARSDKQQEALNNLVDLANKGKGSIWMLISLGGIIGAVISFVLELFSKH